MYKKIVLSTLMVLMHCTSKALDSQLPQDRIAEFTILVTSYNNEKYCEANLASLAYQQSSKPYNIIIVNDCSTDKTGELLEKFIKTHQLESKVTLINNSTRCYSLPNIYSAIHNLIEDHKIVVSVDGDDMLSSDKVLLRLEQEYKNPHIHLTYGSYISGDGIRNHYKKPIPEKVLRKGTIRKTRLFKASHLKTFRAGLFKMVKKEYLMYQGFFLKTAGDVAFMYAMIEMLASPGKKTPLHVSFIPDILYTYNLNNPLNDHKVDSKEQAEKANYILSLKPCPPINTRPLQNSPTIAIS